MAVEYSLNVNGVVLEGRPVNPASCYLLQKVEGLDSRDLREEVNANAGRDGDVTGGQLRTGIRLIITGVINASSLSDLRVKDKALRAALQGGSSFTTTLSGRAGDPGDLTESFWVSAPYRAADDVDSPRLLKDFTFSVRSDADAWKKTGAASSSASTNPDVTRVVTNAGDVKVYPSFVLTATGTATIDYIENVTTGDKLDVSIAVVSTNVITFNTATMSITNQAGANLIASLTAASKWLSMLPGSNSFRFHLSSGTAVTMVVTWQDRYL